MANLVDEETSFSAEDVRKVMLQLSPNAVIAVKTGFGGEVLVRVEGPAAMLVGLRIFEDAGAIYVEDSGFETTQRRGVVWGAECQRHADRAVAPSPSDIDTTANDPAADATETTASTIRITISTPEQGLLIR